MRTTVGQFRAAAEAHLHVAGASALSAPGVPKATPATAAYLSHMAVECSLKSLILKASKAPTTADLEQHHPRIYQALFTGRGGHRLSALADHARVESHLQSNAPGAGDAAWRRMRGDARPYSLRYATEAVTAGEAQAELDLARRLHSEIKPLLGRVG
ncbi:MAG: hypothetical protein IT376_20620 [Polyangiaceae bacterium]|nr:hypothetical protein [Polyangiaceae bacterium]